MPTRPFRSALCLLLAAPILVAAASNARAEDRCSGTFCDFYYEHLATPTSQQPTTPTTPAKPAPGQAAGPPQQPAAAGTATAQPHRLVAVQGGGIIGLMSGAPQQRCTGTLCDFFYGGPPPERPTPEPAAAAARASVTPSAAPGVEPDADDAPAEGGRTVVEPEPHCTVNPRDPWACYR